VQVCAILTVRNEAAFLVDWVAHHLACGITHFVVASNDCEDGTDALLDRLAAVTGRVAHLRNPGPWKRGVQFAALDLAAAHPVITGADWILPLDIDEFVNVHAGDRTIPALVAACPDATAIALTWRLFGNAGVIAYEDRPVPDIFTRAAPSALPWPWRAHMFKTLYRNDGTYHRPGVHRPRGPDPARIDAAVWMDGSGRRMPPRYARAGMFTPPGTHCHGLVQLNHYPLGAVESFILKADRGRAVHGEDRLGMDYWVERNWCDDDDTTIAALAPARDAHKADLMADAALARLHRAAVAWRQERFTHLMSESEAVRALFARCLMVGPSRIPPHDGLVSLERFTRPGRARGSEA
jgi:hypothetical protein